MTCRRLVDDLGLKCTLTDYKVPKEDAPLIVERAFGTKDHPAFAKVVTILEGLY